MALECRDADVSAAFYRRWARMSVVHRRVDAGRTVAWITDGTRPFVIVLIEVEGRPAPLTGIAHLGLGCATRAEVTRAGARARAAGCLVSGPTDLGPPVGYFVIVSDPDGNHLELSHGQEVGLTVERATAKATKAKTRSKARRASGDLLDPDALLEAVRERVAELGGLDEGPSAFGGGFAWRRGRREVGHVHARGPEAEPADGVRDGLWLDVRLPQVERRQRRGDPRLAPRAGRSAWIEVRVRTPDDARFAAELIAAAR